MKKLLVILIYIKNFLQLTQDDVKKEIYDKTDFLIEKEIDNYEEKINGNITEVRKDLEYKYDYYPRLGFSPNNTIFQKDKSSDFFFAKRNHSDIILDTFYDNLNYDVSLVDLPDLYINKTHFNQNMTFWERQVAIETLMQNNMTEYEMYHFKFYFRIGEGNHLNADLFGSTTSIFHFNFQDAKKPIELKTWEMNRRYKKPERKEFENDYEFDKAKFDHKVYLHKKYVMIEELKLMRLLNYKPYCQETFEEILPVHYTCKVTPPPPAPPKKEKKPEPEPDPLTALTGEAPKKKTKPKKIVKHWIQKLEREKKTSSSDGKGSKGVVFIKNVVETYNKELKTNLDAPSFIEKLIEGLGLKETSYEKEKLTKKKKKKGAKGGSKRKGNKKDGKSKKNKKDNDDSESEESEESDEIPEFNEFVENKDEYMKIYDENIVRRQKEDKIPINQDLNKFLKNKDQLMKENLQIKAPDFAKFKKAKDAKAEAEKRKKEAAQAKLDEEFRKKNLKILNSKKKENVKKFFILAVQNYFLKNKKFTNDDAFYFNKLLLPYKENAFKYEKNLLNFATELLDQKKEKMIKKRQLQIELNKHKGKDNLNRKLLRELYNIEHPTKMKINKKIVLALTKSYLRKKKKDADENKNKKIVLRKFVKSIFKAYARNQQKLEKTKKIVFRKLTESFLKNRQKKRKQFRGFFKSLIMNYHKKVEKNKMYFRKFFRHLVKAYMKNKKTNQDQKIELTEKVENKKKNKKISLNKFFVYLAKAYKKEKEEKKKVIRKLYTALGKSFLKKRSEELKPLMPFFKKLVIHYEKNKAKELNEKKIKTELIETKLKKEMFEKRLKRKLFEKIVTLYHNQKKEKSRPKVLFLKSIAKSYLKMKQAKKKMFISLIKSFHRKKERDQKSIRSLFIKIVEKYHAQKNGLADEEERYIEDIKVKDGEKKEKKEKKKKEEPKPPEGPKECMIEVPNKECVDFFQEVDEAKIYYDPFPAPSRHRMFNDSTIQIPYYIKSYFAQNKTDYYVVAVKKHYKRLDYKYANRVPRTEGHDTKDAADVIKNPLKLLNLKPPKKLPPKPQFEDIMKKLLSLIKNVRLYHDMNLILVQITQEQIAYLTEDSKTDLLIGDLSGVMSTEVPGRVKMANRYIAPEVREYFKYNFTNVFYGKPETVIFDKKTDIFPLGISFIRFFAGDTLIGFGNDFLDNECRTEECYKIFLEGYRRFKIVNYEDWAKVDEQEKGDFLSIIKKAMEEIKPHFGFKRKLKAVFERRKKKIKETVENKINNQNLKTKIPPTQKETFLKKLKEFVKYDSKKKKLLMDYVKSRKLQKEKKLTWETIKEKHQVLEFFIQNDYTWHYELLEICEKMIAFHPKDRPSLDEVEKYIKNIQSKGEVGIHMEAIQKLAEMKKKFEADKKKKKLEEKKQKKIDEVKKNIQGIEQQQKMISIG